MRVEVNNPQAQVQTLETGTRGD